MGVIVIGCWAVVGVVEKIIRMEIAINQMIPKVILVGVIADIVVGCVMEVVVVEKWENGEFGN